MKIKSKFKQLKSKNKIKINKVNLIKSIDTLENFINNFKPILPNIFFFKDNKEVMLGMDVSMKKQILCFYENLCKEQNNFIIGQIQKGYEYYKTIINFIKNHGDTKDLWKISSVPPNDISEIIFDLYSDIAIEDKEDQFSILLDNNRELLTIVKEFSLNYLICHEGNQEWKYIYFSSKGLQEIDTYLSSLKMCLTEGFKTMSWDWKLLQELADKIYPRIIAIEEGLLTSKRNSNYKLMFFMVKDVLEKKELPRILKILLTEIWSISEAHVKKNKDKIVTESNEDSILTHNNKTWIKLNINYSTLCFTLGKNFVKILCKMDLAKKDISNEFFSNIIKLFIEMLDNLSITKLVTIEEYKEYLNHVNFIITSARMMHVSTDKNYQIAQRKKSEIILKVEQLLLNSLMLKEKKKKKMVEISTTTLNAVDVNLIRNLCYNFLDSKECVCVELFDKFMIKILKKYLAPRITKFEFPMGDILINLLSDELLYLNKAENIYLNESFYFNTYQKQLFPSFGPAQINMKSLKEETKKHHKFTFAYYNNYNEEAIHYSPKFKVFIPKTSNILNQIEDTKKDFCKVDTILFHMFLLNIEVFFLRYTQNLETFDPKGLSFLKNLFPKESNINLMEQTLSEDTFNLIIHYITNYISTSNMVYKKQYKLPELYLNQSYQTSRQFRDLLEACLTIKLELGRILLAGPLLTGFCGWYPKGWVDARGRNYPYESPLTNTKSPKFRGLIYNITSYITTKSFGVELKTLMEFVVTKKVVMETDLNDFLRTYIKNKKKIISKEEEANKKERKRLKKQRKKERKILKKENERK